MKLIIQGKIEGVIDSKYTNDKGETTITKKLQFMKIDEEKGKKFINVKMDDNCDLTNVKEGRNAAVEVKVSTMEKSFEVFYKQDGELKLK